MLLNKHIVKVTLKSLQKQTLSSSSMNYEIDWKMKLVEYRRFHSFRNFLAYLLS